MRLRKREIPVLYVLLRSIVKLALFLFFQKIELRHAENLPKHGPVVFVVTHPDSTMDAFVITVVTKQRVHYIAYAGLFAHGLKAWLLRACGVIPVIRSPREADKIAFNVEAFEQCYQVLEKGEAISIFPEGISEMTRQVKKLKTGAGRIVLEAERRNHYKLGVKLIPVGLYFFSRSRFRSKVLVNIGRPIDLGPFFALNEKDNVEAVQQLTEKIQDSLEHLTINVRHAKLDALVENIESIYRDELMSQSPAAGKSAKAMVAEFIVSQKIAECVEYFYEKDPQRVRHMHDKIMAYKRKLKRLHLKDVMVRERTNLRTLARPEIRGLAAAIIGFPVAAYGIINNYFPYRLTELIAKRYSRERTKILTALFLGGGAMFVFFYAVQVFLVWNFGGTFPALAYFFSLPLSGFLALAYIKKIREIRERISLSFFLFTNRYLLGKMRCARNELIAELNAGKEEYLTNR
jgi:glycerol-3-phosphate O-acyltransferase / dihydroxyacetone phosphate acyltransferase